MIIMKKWILLICLLIVVIIFSTYLFIAGTQTYSFKTVVKVSENATSRLMLNKERWLEWWPGDKSNTPVFNYKNYHYSIDSIFLNSFGLTVFDDKDTVRGNLQIIPVTIDSTRLQWTSQFHFSANPFQRLAQYSRSRNIHSNIQNLLTEVSAYFEKQEHIYGMAVVKQKVTDSSLISVKKTLQHYPSTEEIYAMVQSLKDYIHKKGGEENNYPMLNIHKDGVSDYQIMVAIPTKKDLPSEGLFHLKKMFLGDILMAEVKGGNLTVIKGEEELTNYLHDYKKISPAIPYQLLVTNRLLEKDTLKWITKLYYPVFY